LTGGREGFGPPIEAVHDDTRTLLDPVRTPVFERGGLALSVALLVAGAASLALVLSGVLHQARPATPPPPPVVAAPTPVPGLSAAPGPQSRAIVVRRPLREQRADGSRFAATDTTTHILAGWESGFYRLYETASRTFGVNWLLLASIHKQETAFSTSPSTYHGLNHAGCCGGPMQFNVTNRPVPTWRLVRDSYRYAARPGVYNHPTARHPSIYDDFDALMAAARLLASDGAGANLDGSAWLAAYDYYGHDATGVTYADQVLARAISWSQGGFCINCALDSAMVATVHAAYAPAVAPKPARALAQIARARRGARRGASRRAGGG
jgi:hypothetical protein